MKIWGAAKLAPQFYFQRKETEMKISADHHFSIGEQHLKQGKPCQDYAISGEFENLYFAIVSDGCSGGQNTDVGARFTALSAGAAIKNSWFLNCDAFDEKIVGEIDIEQNIIQRGTYRILGLKEEDMLATCLYACFSDSGGFAHILGDGVLAWKSADGLISMRRFDWADNAPMYPIYRENNFRTFTQFHGGNIEARRLTAEEWIYAPNRGHEHVKTSEFTVGDGIKGQTEAFSALCLEGQKIEFVAIFSDGITQVENMDWKDAVFEMLSFKNTAWAFAKRRAISFLKNTRDSGKRPMDDLAYAVIRIGQEYAK